MRSPRSIARSIRSAWRGLFHRTEVERDLNDEIALHIELEVERNIERGMSPGEARRQALVAFGGIEHVREAHRDGRGSRWFEDLFADARFALRTLRRSPTHAITAITTLALGIGATTAIVAVVNQVIIRPLPVASPDRLVMLWEENPDRAWKFQTLSPANYLDLKERVHAFESTGAWFDFETDAALTGDGDPMRVGVIAVSGDLFSTLGVRPLLGRDFRQEETWNTGAHVIMLSHRLWRERYGADRTIVGRTIQLNAIAHEVIGVLPQSFRLPGLDPDIWTPTQFATENRTRASFRRAHYMRGVARLRSGETVEHANAEVRTVMRTLEHDFPETNTHMSAGVTPLHEFLVGDTRRPLLLLLSAVGVLLLIACANVGNLVLVHAGARQREVALRLALGAKRSRLVRQSLTESVMLALIGGTAGIGIGWFGVRALAAMQPAGLLPNGSIDIEWTTVAFVFAVSTLSGLAFGVAPALWQSRRLPSDMLKEGARTGSGKRMQRWTSALVVSEVAMAAMLTVGAGLLVRSYWKLQQVDPGYRPDGVMTMSFGLSASRYDSLSRLLPFLDEVTTRARALPGVQHAALVTSLPSTHYSWSSDFAVQGAPVSTEVNEVVHREISAEYPQVMGLELKAGRLLNDGDRQDSPLVVLINDVMAKRYFANDNPIGKRIAFDRVPDSNSVWRTIVGVVSSERQANVALEPRPEILAPLSQESRRRVSLVVKTKGDPLSLAGPLRQIMRELDDKLPIASMRTMNDVRGEAVARERFLVTVLLSFAVVGMMLALVGVYGVIAQLARGRLREMGIRLALGAPAYGVQWLVLKRGLVLTTIGLGIGLVCAAAGSSTLGILLYEIQPLDIATFVMVPVLLIVSATIASWLPARRASNVDPVTTLRQE